MAYLPNNDLEILTEGQGDWDADINANFAIIDRGFHRKLTAATLINTGDICIVASGGIAVKHDPKSLSNTWGAAMAYKQVVSGATDTFLLWGAISSVGVWSGNITPGQPVYSSAVTPGFAVSSYSAAAYPVGIALTSNAMIFAPGRPMLPEKITQVQTLGPFATGSTHAFNLNIGHRGFIRRVEVANSYSLWTMKFHSGSARVSSELLYETQSGGVTSNYLLDAAGFPYENTDTASPGMLFGNVLVSSGASSGYFTVRVVAERLR